MVVLERYAPSAAGLAGAAAGWFGLPTWLPSAGASGLELSEVFGAAFDTATFAAGILFTIYILILAPNGTFVEKLFGTKMFAIFHRYVSAGILSALTLSVFSIYYVIAGLPDVTTIGPHLAASAWLGLLAYSSVAVGRVILVFLVLIGAEARAPKRMPPTSRVAQ